MVFGFIPESRSASLKRGWRGGRVGNAIAPAGGCEGIQEVLADETADETGSAAEAEPEGDRKSTRLNSSHLGISYAVFCLKKKTRHIVYAIVRADVQCGRRGDLFRAVA